jgi:di/tricarboxylate transporter
VLCVRLQPVFFILHTAFFGLHYLFASQTAHIGALYAAFLAMMLASGEHEEEWPMLQPMGWSIGSTLMLR